MFDDDQTKPDRVSIHAPAWGATSHPLITLPVTMMFQSTRPRGARRQWGSAKVDATMFQSTRPRGARRWLQAERDRWIAVSIHAPAWGATCRRKRSRSLPRSFNPRARVGRDLSVAGAMTNGGKFQSTRPRGARHAVPVHHPLHDHVSIHAPAWGATAITARCWSPSPLFQSTRPRGARRS